MKVRIIRDEIIVPAPKDLAFGVFFVFDFIEVFRNLWFVAPYECPILKEQHFRPGFEHRIYFDNGNKAVRKLSTFLPQTSFSALICGFDSKVPTISSVAYSYRFFEHTDDSCRVSCEYHFLFECWFCAMFFDLFCRHMICSNLNRIMDSAAAKCLEA